MRVAILAGAGLLLLPALLAARVGSTEPAQSQGAALATASLPPSVAPAPGSSWSPKPDLPVSLGAAPRAGRITFWDAGHRWEYDGASGELTPTEPAKDGDRPAGALSVARRPGSDDVAWVGSDHKLVLRHERQQRTLFADHDVSCVLWAPDGSLLAVFDLPPRAGQPSFQEWERTQLGLWIIDPATGAARRIYADAPLANAITPPTLYSPFRVASWSPDGRYLALWRIDMVSASADADGHPLFLVDVATGEQTDLGKTLLYRWLAWRAPHTLAYISGGDRFTWEHKQLRIWSPEGGLRDLTPPSESALAPVWSADEREILFVSGPAGEYRPIEHFSGTGIGARSLVALDPETGVRRTFPAAAQMVQEGVRQSRDGAARLELRRRTVPPSWTTGKATPPIEAWYIDAEGAVPVIRLAVYGFGYYGAYPALASFEWDR